MTDGSSASRVVLDYAFTAEGSVYATPTHVEYPKGTWDRDDLSYERPLAAPDPAG